MLKTAIVATLALGLTACATTYGEIGGWSGDGVAADQLAADTFRIRSRGNGATEPAVIQDFALLRAAETLKQACHTHFVVLNSADRTTVDEVVTPETVTRTVEKKEVDGKEIKTVSHQVTPATHSIVVRPGQDLIVRGVRIAPGATPPAEAHAVDDILAYVAPRVVRRKNAPPVLFPACG